MYYFAKYPHFQKYCIGLFLEILQLFTRNKIASLEATLVLKLYPVTQRVNDQ